MISKQMVSILKFQRDPHPFFLKYIDPLHKTGQHFLRKLHTPLIVQEVFQPSVIERQVFGHAAFLTQEGVDLLLECRLRLCVFFLGREILALA